MLTGRLNPQAAGSVTGGTIGPSGAGEGRSSEQELGVAQDRRRPACLATGWPTHTGAAGRGSVRVERAPVGAGGLH